MSQASTSFLRLSTTGAHKGLHKDFINYDLLETYKDFGGIRIEDDILITKDGCRFLGEKRIPYHPADMEEFRMRNSQ